MTKLYMSRYIAAQLFQLEEKLAPADNWKVQELMKRPKPALEHLYELALDAHIAREPDRVVF